MKSIKNLERLQQLHSLIEKEQTGGSLELARRMHISQRLVYSLMEQLKDFNAAILYDRGRKTYYYKDDFQFEVNISVSVRNKNTAMEIFGGSYI
ncbi:DNA-binding protein [Sungkyunkwania multivorans]|uniref:DNA-binding protein n=1 Tax=Sungkyunkwania multivorans TaxID=1173618 RepID=A0ABW3CZZ8_9FLAO